MSEKDDLDLINLDQRRWVRYDLPVLVCVDTDENSDQHVRHVVPMLDDIELSRDDRHNPVVYDPDGTELVDNPREDDAAWYAVTHSGATKDTWVGEKPYTDWDWLEDPEDLTATARYTQDEEDEYPGEEDDELEWTPTR